MIMDICKEAIHFSYRKNMHIVHVSKYLNHFIYTVKFKRTGI